jgi:UDP-N-acetylglucosamine--dolichyl-phosphate N-acetylglucosaminephosphotransferase
LSISIILLFSLLLSFLATLLLAPKFIRFLEVVGVSGIDVQKRDRPRVAEMGGPVVLAGFLIAIFFYIGAKIFFYGEVVNLVEMFAAVTTIMIIAMIGMLDDIGNLSSLRICDNFRNVNKRIGLKKWVKPLLTLPAAIPLMAIMAGDSAISIPLIGSVNTGLLYPLLLIPIGVVGASNATNILAGMNGLEAGMGSVLLLALGAYALSVGSMTAAVIALVYAVALLAFLRYNWYPARIMPGDSMNYSIGAVAAVVAIIGNIEKFAIYCFFLWFIELVLKARSRFKADSFGILQADGTLAAPSEKIYSLTHFVMKLGRFSEKQVVAILIGMQIVVSLTVVLAYSYLI